MAKAVEVKPEEMVAREYADRLILAQIAELHSVVKLSEIADRLQKEGIGLAAVRALLASNPNKFSYTERRWVPASRVEGEGRPLAEQIRLIAERFGGPIPISFVINELGTHREIESEDFVRRVVTPSNGMLMTANDEVVLRNWCFTCVDDSLEVALSMAKISPEEFETASKTLEKINWRSPGAIESALKAGAPISAKVVGAVAWSKLNPVDPTSFHLFEWDEFYRELFAVPGFVFSSNGVIHPESDAKKWISTAIKLADRIAPTVDMEDVAPIEFKSGDVDKMVAKIAKSDASVTATRLLEEFYEITPSVKTFPDDLANLQTALNQQSSIQWVGGDRYSKLGVVPDFVNSVPEIFQYPVTNFTDEEGELVDVELTDEGLSSTLRKLVNHPLATDVLDEDLMATPKQQPESIRCVLKSIHREIGTFPLCQIPSGWLTDAPEIQEITLQDADGRELQIWMNTKARLMFGFIDWFYDQQVESGSVFSLTKTPRPNVLEFAWLDQTDPVVFITSQRMDELREIQSRAEGLSTFEILREVMSHWPKGADFLTLLWEVNVVRRSTRRLVASLLSSYACFYQRSGSPVWHYDQKKVEQGFDKTKKKFVVKR